MMFGWKRRALLYKELWASTERHLRIVAEERDDAYRTLINNSLPLPPPTGKSVSKPPAEG